MRGIGTDIVAISRIAHLLERFPKRFVRRILTPDEKRRADQLADPLPFIAGRFSAKEALAKALGSGIGSLLRWKEIEILNHPITGSPRITLLGEAQQRFDFPQMRVSISHCREYAIAYAHVS
ncbi:MAG: holo-ACP synthase [Chlamydiota bacterium]|nr:holo-ACP synthase [Chlamydiota bacterium]